MPPPLVVVLDSILWVVPAPLLPIVQAEVDIVVDRLIVPEAMQTIDVRGIRITPFDGLHWDGEPESQSPRGVPAMGFLVGFNGKRWLFPGDTRTYDASQLPGFGPVDGVFAHVWLGRGCALMDEPPLLNEFCQFFVSMRSKQIVLSHLYEFGRDAHDFWDNRHVQDVSSCILNSFLDKSTYPTWCLGEDQYLTNRVLSYFRHSWMLFDHRIM